MVKITRIIQKAWPKGLSKFSVARRVTMLLPPNAITSTRSAGSSGRIRERQANVTACYEALAATSAPATFGGSAVPSSGTCAARHLQGFHL
jgi:hypothetical protein